MRRLLALVACSVIAVPMWACEKRVYIQQPPGEDGAGVDGGRGSTPAGTPAGKDTDPLVIDLGDIESGVETPFDVPAGALGFNVIIEGKDADYDPDAPYGIERITDPTGKVVHDGFTPNGGTSVTSVAEFDTIAAASIPQGEATLPVAGTWKLRVGVKGGTKKVIVHAKVRVQSSGDGEFHGGKLDLHLHVPEGLKVDSETISGTNGEASPAIKQRIDIYFKVLSQLLELDRGSVTFHPAPARLANVDGAEELLEGFSASAGETDGTQSLHVLLTNQISLDGKPIASGISPGIPGAATVFGRAVSTIIIATSGSSNFDAITMVHETGHFFGLNHTTEFGGSGGDPLADTPRCTSLSGQPTLDQMKTCPDKTNIMFPATPVEGPISLSPEQKRVYRGSPVYKAYKAGTQRTQSLEPEALPSLELQFRSSGGALSPVETELSLGFCGLNKLDPEGMLARYGKDTAIAQLRAAAEDADLSPIIRGRAGVTLAKLGLSGEPR